VRPEARRSFTGLLYALGAYGLWGVSPVYWKWVSAVPADEMLAWRALWAFAITLAFGALTGRARHARPVLRRPRLLLALGLTGGLLALNWFTFIWAIQTDRITATSLGYYMSPLVHVLLGMLVLGERLVRAQAFALAIATAGVVYLTVEYGELPWIARLLPTSFGVYGLVRKIAPVQPLVGFGVEMLLLLPLALGYLGWLLVSGRSVMLDASADLHGLVAASGLVTATPLIWFVYGARRLPLTTLGMFQYVAPSLSLVLAVWLYGEPFTRVQAVTFLCVWVALSLYSIDVFARMRSESPLDIGERGQDSH
jgi:chloramphenicol-sensitive protein RarD